MNSFEFMPFMCHHVKFRMIADLAGDTNCGYLMDFGVGGILIFNSYRLASGDRGDKLLVNPNHVIWMTFDE